jgi:hypothetical protein
MANFTVSFSALRGYAQVHPPFMATVCNTKKVISWANFWTLNQPETSSYFAGEEKRRYSVSDLE